MEKTSRRTAESRWSTAAATVTRAVDKEQKQKHENGTEG